MSPPPLFFSAHFLYHHFFPWVKPKKSGVNRLDIPPLFLFPPSAHFPMSFSTPQLLLLSLHSPRPPHPGSNSRLVPPPQPPPKKCSKPGQLKSFIHFPLPLTHSLTSCRERRKLAHKTFSENWDGGGYSHFRFTRSFVAFIFASSSSVQTCLFFCKEIPPAPPVIFAE